MLEARGLGYQGKQGGSPSPPFPVAGSPLRPESTLLVPKRHVLPNLAEVWNNRGVKHSSAGAPSLEHQLARKGMRSYAAEQLGRRFSIGEQIVALLETNSDRKNVSRYGERLPLPTIDRTPTTSSWAGTRWNDIVMTFGSRAKGDRRPLVRDARTSRLCPFISDPRPMENRFFNHHASSSSSPPMLILVRPLPVSSCRATLSA